MVDPDPESESKALLPNYGTAASSKRHSLLQPTAGRGPLRFAARQAMRKNHRSQSQSTFASVFAAQKFRKPRRRPQKDSPPKSEKGAERADDGSTPLSIDGDLPAGRRDDDPKDQTTTPTKHSQLYKTLDSKSKSPSACLFQKFISCVIIFDAFIYILSTDPELSHLSRYFYYTEGVISSIFAIEYVARLVVCTEKRGYGKHGPIRGRWEYARSFQALVDALATFPFFLELLSGIPLPTLTYIRVFRLLRITRTQSCSHAMDAVWRVLYFNREILHVAVLLGVYLVIITGVLMYYLRPRGKDVEYVDDPDDFSSIASTMVLSTLMLTGQGGPSGQLPWYTQGVVLLTGIFSVAMFAIPASMLTWGFEAEAERLGMRAKKKALAKRRGEVYSSDTSSSSSGCDSDGSSFSTSDEEYLNIIGGNDDDEVASNQNASSLGSDEIRSLFARVQMMEQNVMQTNKKLDLILQKLGERQ